MLMFQNNVIPPHVGIKNRINAKFPPLQEKNVRIAQSVEKFHPSEDGIRRVWINNFNATVSSPPITFRTTLLTLLREAILAW
jgi:hypothetical protein